jgi:glycosyltransferase involved in cell wall biosynthesis
MWLIQALCGQYDVTLVTSSQFDFDFFNRFAGTRIEPDQFHIRRLPLLPTPRALPMSAIQGPLFQRSARACAAEFDLCLSAMNPLDLGVTAVHFLADLDWLQDTEQTSDSLTAPGKRRKVSAPRRLYHALSARVQARSGRNVLREDVLVSNSEWVASSLHTIGVESSVIYPPVPWHAREKDWESRRNDFVWIGRIDPSKRLEHAVSIVAGLRNAGIDCAIHIVGTAVYRDYHNSIRSLARRMGDWVVLEGPLYGEEKENYLSQFRYAIHTRADEPFGITLVELMKAGCIPFAPDSCGSAEILNHPALLFAGEDDAVTKIRKVISDPELSQSVRTFLRHRADLFSTETFCDSVVTLVSNILECASSRSDVRTFHTPTGSGHIGNHGT